LADKPSIAAQDSRRAVERCDEGSAPLANGLRLGRPFVIIVTIAAPIAIPPDPNFAGSTHAGSHGQTIASERLEVALRRSRRTEDAHGIDRRRLNDRRPHRGSEAS
jgi:hypothetical protein